MTVVGGENEGGVECRGDDGFGSIESGKSAVTLRKLYVPNMHLSGWLGRSGGSLNGVCARNDPRFSEGRRFKVIWTTVGSSKIDVARGCVAGGPRPGERERTAGWPGIVLTQLVASRFALAPFFVGEINEVLI